MINLCLCTVNSLLLAPYIYVIWTHYCTSNGMCPQVCFRVQRPDWTNSTPGISAPGFHIGPTWRLIWKLSVKLSKCISHVEAAETSTLCKWQVGNVTLRLLKTTTRMHCTAAYIDSEWQILWTQAVSGSNRVHVFTLSSIQMLSLKLVISRV